MARLIRIQSRRKRFPHRFHLDSMWLRHYTIPSARVSPIILLGYERGTNARNAKTEVTKEAACNPPLAIFILAMQFQLAVIVVFATRHAQALASRSNLLGLFYPRNARCFERYHTLSTCKGQRCNNVIVLVKSHRFSFRWKLLRWGFTVSLFRIL